MQPGPALGGRSREAGHRVAVPAARVPDLRGFGPDCGLPAGVHALCTLDDAREIVAATVNARVVVVGAGVLGLEVACGLARRRLAVTVVHGGPHRMDRQLYAAAGLTSLGIGIRVAARTQGRSCTTRGSQASGSRAAKYSPARFSCSPRERSPRRGSRSSRGPTSSRWASAAPAGRVVGATCVGTGPVAADLTAAYTHATPALSDPAQLLVRPVAGAAVPVASPTLMPDRTTVCRCDGVTKGDVVACRSCGGEPVEDVARETRATTGCGGCGGCTDVMCGLLGWLATTEPDRSSRVSGRTDSALSMPGSASSVKREPRRVPCCGSEMPSSASRPR